MINYEAIHLDPNNRKTNSFLDYIHPDFIEIGQSGKTFTQSDLKSNTLAIFEYDVVDFEWKSISKDARLCIYTLINHTKQSKSRRSSIWLWYEGDWKLYFHQGTPFS
ncbi:hypothetical protein HYI43_07120 [Staphylococcus taiwanensis]|nr:hypothetical protein HYI43_07120 [Staphylococcus taiwanensis]